MTDTTLVLHEQRTGPVLADGTCTLTVGPTLQHEQWDTPYLSVGNSGAAAAQCRVYKGAPVASNYLQGTEHATGDGSQVDVSLRAGQFLTCVFSGADVGSVCTVTVDGEKKLLGVSVYG